MLLNKGLTAGSCLSLGEPHNLRVHPQGTPQLITLNLISLQKSHKPRRRYFLRETDVLSRLARSVCGHTHAHTACSYLILRDTHASVSVAKKGDQRCSWCMLFVIIGGPVSVVQLDHPIIIRKFGITQSQVPSFLITETNKCLSGKTPRLEARQCCDWSGGQCTALGSSYGQDPGLQAGLQANLIPSQGSQAHSDSGTSTQNWFKVQSTSCELFLLNEETCT